MKTANEEVKRRMAMVYIAFTGYPCVNECKGNSDFITQSYQFKML